MKVHAARTQSPQWDAWDTRWSEGYEAAVDAGVREGQQPGASMPTAEHLRSLRRPNPAFERWAAVVVDDDGTVLGGAKIGLPQHEDPEVGYVELLAVAPGHRRRGAGTLLAAWTRDTLRAGGRRRVVTDTSHPVGVETREWPALRFCEHVGLAVSLTGASRELRLPVPADRLAALDADVTAASAGYRLLSWEGPCPDDAAARGMAALHARMSTDAPNGDPDHEEERWDADRVRTEDARSVGMGRRWWTAVAVAPDGTWVGYSVLMWVQSLPTSLSQEDTLVLAGHRGHRLGLALKLEVLRAATAAVPEAVRVATWNADSNAPMIAVNVAMGYRVTDHGQEWLGTL